MNKKIRTRFAPSPTGYMHVGGIRTALFAWLVAKQSDGVFALRVEDTDKAREVEGSIEHIAKSLDWLGLERDEGPFAGGDYGPYLQSQRIESYKEWATKLYKEGKAYADPYSAEEVQAFREQAQAAKKPFLYRNHRPENPPEWDGSQPLRLKIEVTDKVHWHDEVRGDLSAGADSLDDFILMKADGYPTYNFAHIVDDYNMEITHVIRGEEFISSTPKFIKLYEALGFEIPKLITVPPILGSNGGKKLSKRDGAKDVLDYGVDGYLPEALLNYLASLGWNDGTEQEIFTTDELIEKFSIDRIQQSGAKWDLDRMTWMNGHHIRNKPLDELYGMIDRKYWPSESEFNNGEPFDEAYEKQILGLVQEKLKKFDELEEAVEIFCKRLPLDTKLATKDFDALTAADIIDDIENNVLSKIDEFTSESIEKALRTYVEDKDLHTGKVFKLIRLTACRKPVAPGLFETLEALGQSEVSIRLNTAQAELRV